MVASEAPRWAVVLAGGDGVRLRPYVQRRFGDLRPKQYCAFSGSRSMLQHTLGRAAQLVPAARIVTVVSAGHEPWARPQLAEHPGKLIVQSHNRETGPGLYLPLASVRARDPHAVVYILPSDHYVEPGDRFVAAVRSAGNIASEARDRIVLVGVAPEGPEPDYGYVEPGPEILGTPVHQVARFVEKPARADAEAAIGRGALWNTMVIAATVDALWTAACATQPQMIGLFDQLVAAIDTADEATALEAIYLAMPVVNFSRDILERVPERCLLTRLDRVEWSDWGQADRIEATIQRKRCRRAPPTAAALAPALATTAGA